MTLLKRRVVAQAIDFILIAMIVALIPKEIPFLMVIQEACLIALVLTKDLLFRNASIGKKLLHLVVLDKNGERPKLSKMMLRNATVLFLFWLEYWLMKKGKQRLGDSLCDTHVEVDARDI